MKIAILQPSFLPWPGFFEQMALVDCFVYLDDVQYTKQDWRNRNRLKSPSGVVTVSVPVQKPAHSKTLINEAKISYDHPWQDKLIRKIISWYSDTPFFEDYFSEIKKVLQHRYDFLVDLNYALIDVFCKKVSIKTPLRLSSELSTTAKDKNQKLLDTCLALGADIFYDGYSAQNFINEELFKKNGVQMVYQDYKAKPYPQLWGPFEPNLSMLDLLLNCGDESKDVLLASPIAPLLAQ